MITKLTCCVLLIFSLLQGAWTENDSVTRQDRQMNIIHFYSMEGTEQAAEDLLLENGCGLLPVLESEDASSVFAGWAFFPYEEQEPKERFLLQGQVENWQVQTNLENTLDLKPYFKENSLSLYARWKQAPIPAALESDFEEILLEEVLIPEPGEETAFFSNGLPELRTEPGPLEEPWTIRFQSEREAVEDLVFYSNDRVSWPLMNDEDFLGWKICSDYQKTNRLVEGGFDPAADLILPASRLDFQVAEYADVQTPDLSAGLTTLTPFFIDRTLELEAVYETSKEKSLAQEEKAEEEELLAANTAYAVFVPSSGSLDFYWGVPQASSASQIVMSFDLYQTSSPSWPWLNYASSITAVTFHNQYTPVLFSGWFSGCSKLKSVQGTNKLNWSNCINASAMFSGCSSLTSLDVSSFQTGKVTNFGSMFYGCSSLTSLDVSGWKTSSCTTFASMFMNCSSLQQLAVSEFDVSHARSLSGLFRNCAQLSSLDVADWTVSSCTDFSGMFSGCSALQTLDLSEWDTSSAATFFMMFLDCTSLQIQGLENWKTEHVTSLNRTFNGVQNADLNLNSWNTSANTSLEWCFGNTAAKTIEIADWDVSSVTSMASMCAGAKSLTTFDVSAWKTSSLQTLEDAFRYASSLEGLDMGTWDMSHLVSLYQTFQYCSALNTLDVSSWNLQNCSTLYCTFNECTSLSVLDPSLWNTSQVNNMRWTFGSCSQLQFLDLSGWNTDAVQRMDHLFYDMASLESLNLSGPDSWNTQKASDLQAMFLESPKLSQVSLSKNFSFQGAAPSSLQAIFMDAPAAGFPVSAVSELPQDLQGAWMCQQTSDNTSLYAAPALLQQDYQGSSMAGLWTWAAGGLLEIEVDFTGDNPALPSALQASLNQKDGYTKPDGSDPIAPALVDLTSQEQGRKWTASQIVLEGSSLSVSSLSELPAGYVLISSSGPVSEENVMQVTPGLTDKAQFVYQSYLPVAFPDTGRKDGLLLIALASILVSSCALLLLKQVRQKSKEPQNGYWK